MSTRTTSNRVCCFAVKQLSRKGVDLLLVAFPLAYLFNYVFVSYSTILHHSPSFFFSLPALSLRYRGNGKREWSKRERQRAEIFYRGLWEPTDKGLHLNPSLGLSYGVLGAFMWSLRVWARAHFHAHPLRSSVYTWVRLFDMLMFSFCAIVFWILHFKALLYL